MGFELHPDFFLDANMRLGKECARLTRLVWPNFLVEPSDIPDPARQFEIDAEELSRLMPVWGIRRHDDQRLVANASALLIKVDLSQNRLPDAGWRFAMEVFANGEEPNCVCLLAANVDPEFRSLGFSQVLLEHAKVVTRNAGLRTLIGPVRPVLKSSFPELSMADYTKKLSDSGEAFDPWIRLHVRLGAEVFNICPQSVIVKASLSKWQAWTGLAFGQSGEQALPLGLAPLVVDLETGVGTYTEPNLWVRYTLS